MEHIINSQLAHPKADEQGDRPVKSEFERMLFSAEVGREGRGGDFMWPVRHANLSDEVNKRVGCPEEPDRMLSGRFVVEQAAERYFYLVADAERTMRGKFTEEEFVTILNTTCGPIWEWDTYMSVASMVADTFGVGRLDSLKEGSELRVLLKKLLDLSAVQNAALVDTCERVWRGHANNLLDEVVPEDDETSVEAS
ncbi:MAG: hypothetical protein IH627_13080 [Rubrivivax sp.]|nr:hypothetical protein [Rubrivivax sp.]